MAGRELPAGFIGFANYCIRKSYVDKKILHEHPRLWHDRACRFGFNNISENWNQYRDDACLICSGYSRVLLTITMDCYCVERNNLAGYSPVSDINTV